VVSFAITEIVVTNDTGHAKRWSCFGDRLPNLAIYIEHPNCCEHHEIRACKAMYVRGKSE
jgi:hypothetical protein